MLVLGLRGVSYLNTNPSFSIIKDMITFKYSKNKEEKILDIQKEKARYPESIPLIERFIRDVPITESDPFIQKHIKTIGSIWQEMSVHILSGLGDFFEKSLKEPDLACYLTRTTIFPYDYKSVEKWFSAPLFGNPLEIKRVIAHEVCHYLQPTELPGPIKEAIPIILNDRETFGVMNTDRGHLDDEEEQKWRRIIWDLRKEGKKYSDLLELGH